MNKQKPSRFRYFCFRALAIGIGLLPFVLFEFGLFVSGWNETNEVHDPYIGFSQIRPLFVLNEEKTLFEVSPARYPLFRPENFAANKTENEFRIFCLGGSTVQGRPFAIETSFSTWLEIALNAAAPARKWEVVNCGGVSYASYRLVPILKEILNYKPDLIILYTGHNEFLEDRTYASIKQTPSWITASHESLSFFKTYRFLRSLFVSDQVSENEIRNGKQFLPVDVEAELDFKNGLEFYQRDEVWKQNVVQHFEFNLRQMANISNNAKLPMLLVNPVCNLKETAPFKSANRDDLTESARAKFEAGLNQLTNSKFASVDDELQFIEGLLEIDNQFAGLNFRAGQCLLALNRIEEARQHFIDAKENDICPLRILEPMRATISQIASYKNLTIVDLQSFFERKTVDGITGNETLVDHVHPSIRAHQQIADQLIQTLLQNGSIEITETNWQKKRVEKYAEHLQTLDFMYYQHGKDRLRGLQRWTRGEVQKVRPTLPDDNR